jgi:hypothetical protein
MRPRAGHIGECIQYRAEMSRIDEIAKHDVIERIALQRHRVKCGKVKIEIAGDRVAFWRRYH